MRVAVVLLGLIARCDGFVRGPRLGPVRSPLRRDAVALDPSGVSAEARDRWIKDLDYEKFGAEMKALERELNDAHGDEDVEHLQKMVRWSNGAGALGLLTMWLPLNPVSVVALSTWTFSRWAIIAHHTMHGGFNRCDAGRFNSRGFAVGSLYRRCVDWLDWMMPEGWAVEHNNLHHYRLGEKDDPDLVERNLDWLRDMKLALPLKYAIAVALMPVWKPFYYCVNTYKELCIAESRREKRPLPENFDPLAPVTLKTLLAPQGEQERAAQEFLKPLRFLRKVMLPFAISRFLLLPAPLLLLPAGNVLFLHAIANLVAAELLTNIHSFIVIVTNHAGSDLYKFRDGVHPQTPSFYVRQVVSSANFKLGTDALDFSQGFLNYQIEHHTFPSHSMRQYQKGAPRVEEICERHGVPYVKENVFIRLKKTLDIMVGTASMIEFPVELEPAADKRRAA